TGHAAVGVLRGARALEGGGLRRADLRRPRLQLPRGRDGSRRARVAFRAMKRGKKRRKSLRGTRIAVLGAGRAGRNLATRCAREGAAVRVWSRRKSTSPIAVARGAHVVLICVSDRAIAEVARALAKSWVEAGERAKPVALHVSGYHDEKPLAPLRRL